MTETTFFTDSTPPTDFTGDLHSVFTGANSGIEYMLYTDTAVWDPWYDWAQVNGFSATGFETYSSRALKIVGHWPTMQANSADTDNGETDNTTKSFMCITAAGKGGVCMEALIGSSENTVNTYYLKASEIATKLETPLGTLALSGTVGQTTTDYDFAGTSIGTPALTLVAENPSAPVDFSAFKVANCSLTPIKMDCRNWVVKEAKEDTNGLIHYSDGDAVKFWWFDGRYYKDNTADTPESYWTSDNIAQKF